MNSFGRRRSSAFQSRVSVLRRTVVNKLKFKLSKRAPRRLRFGALRLFMSSADRSPLGSDGNGKRHFHRSFLLALAGVRFYTIRWNPPHIETHVFIHIPPVVLRCVLRSVEYLYHINFPINFNDDESVPAVSLYVNAKASGYKTQRSPENRNSKRISRLARRYSLSQSDR